MASYAARGLRLRYEQAGGGRPVVLLHGMSNHCLAWAPQLAAVADGLLSFDVTEALAGVRVPVLAVAGQHDRLATPQMVEQVAASVPGGRLEVVEDAQHLVSLERPDRFNELLLGLLAQA